MDAYPLRAYGQLLFLCVVCGKAQARIALHVGLGREIGLCSSRACIDAPDRDMRFRRAARRGADSYVACQWAGVVQMAASFDPPSHLASLAPSRVVNMGHRRPVDPRTPKTFNFGSDGFDD